MNEQTPTNSQSGATWATWAPVDETFFRIVADVFSHSFCEGASVLLATNDADEFTDPEPTVIRLPEQRAGADAEQAARRAAMQRHPSARRQS